MAEITRAELARSKHAADRGVEKDKAYYRDVAYRINGLEGTLQKLWKQINKFVLGATFVTPETVESVAITGKLPPLDLTTLKGPAGIIGAEMAVGSGMGIAAYLTALAAAGIVVPIVGSVSAVAAGLTMVGLYKVVRFRKEHETDIEQLIKMHLEYDKNEKVRGEGIRRSENEQALEVDAFRAAEIQFQSAGFIKYGVEFSKMLTTIHNYAVVQRSVELQPDLSEEQWTDEQRKAAFVINYLEQTGVIKRKPKKNGYFEPGNEYRVLDRHDRQYRESEDLAKRILANVAYAENEYGRNKIVSRRNS